MWVFVITAFVCVYGKTMDTVSIIFVQDLTSVRITYQVSLQC